MSQQAEVGSTLQAMLLEEMALKLPRFTNDDAFALGSRLINLAKKKTPYKGITIQITRNGQTLFLHAMEGTTADNENWARRKTNTVVRLQHSSYYIGRLLASKGETDMEKTYKVSMDDYACHGGGFPLFIENVGCVGAAVVSGLPQAEDHALVVQGIREMLETMLQGE
ncbi:hypothetical protein BGZ65_005296 [Modicella reniformis]|uniref:Uncharacterized protein n=1 Tax=Modicella reniformis TaxID=1440133 RepID=A0A9P6LSQ4_9FUNG|nr:hypothetical protein BGZ65_005296 [Modicella reniformis]